ncbi:glycosyltransferase [Paenibacillus puldeungensis]|uniref:Glycosyltransferase n=1 Tax=Paenibacillus puldeungensis TaxID=696536 RepID=A0ABW3RZR3_9BACL
MISPVYNDERNIHDLYSGIKEALKDKIESYEIVLVNDGSRDGSTRLLNELAQSDKTVKVIHFDKSYGKTAAIWAGIKNSCGELIALMDADLQSDPRDILKMMSFIQNNDFVNGRREDWKDFMAKKWILRMENRF